MGERKLPELQSAGDAVPSSGGQASRAGVRLSPRCPRPRLSHGHSSSLDRVCPDFGEGRKPGQQLKMVPLSSHPQTQVGVLQPRGRRGWDRTSYEPSPRHIPGLRAKELAVTQPAKEGVVEAVPQEKHRLQAEGRWGRWAPGSLLSRAFPT